MPKLVEESRKLIKFLIFGFDENSDFTVRFEAGAGQIWRADKRILPKDIKFCVEGFAIEEANLGVGQALGDLKSCRARCFA